MSAMITRMPSATNWVAMPLPIPEAPPVTTATFPRRSGRPLTGCPPGSGCPSRSGRPLRPPWLLLRPRDRVVLSLETPRSQARAQCLSGAVLDDDLDCAIGVAGAYPIAQLRPFVARRSAPEPPRPPRPPSAGRGAYRGRVGCGGERVPDRLTTRRVEEVQAAG